MQSSSNPVSLSAASSTRTYGRRVTLNIRTWARAFLPATGSTSEQGSQKMLVKPRRAVIKSINDVEDATPQPSKPTDKNRDQATQNGNALLDITVPHWKSWDNTTVNTNGWEGEHLDSSRLFVEARGSISRLFPGARASTATLPHGARPPRRKLVGRLPRLAATHSYLLRSGRRRDNIRLSRLRKHRRRTNTTPLSP